MESFAGGLRMRGGIGRAGEHCIGVEYVTVEIRGGIAKMGRIGMDM